MYLYMLQKYLLISLEEDLNKRLLNIFKRTELYKFYLFLSVCVFYLSIVFIFINISIYRAIKSRRI